MTRSIYFATLLDFFETQDYKIIPIYWGVTKFHTISLGGWKKITIDANDTTFTEVCKVASAVMKTFIDLFKETHAFSEPQIIFKKDGILVIKFGMMDIEEYNERNGKKNA